MNLSADNSSETEIVHLQNIGTDDAEPTAIGNVQTLRLNYGAPTFTKNERTLNVGVDIDTDMEGLQDEYVAFEIQYETFVLLRACFCHGQNGICWGGCGNWLGPS
jgi:hypothetical protein